MQAPPARDVLPSQTWTGVLWLVLAGAAIAGVVLLVSRPMATDCRQPTRVEHDLRNIIMVAEAIYTDTDSYPDSIYDMLGTGRRDVVVTTIGLDELPRDPWGHEYLYEITSDGRPRATCLGSDGQPGGEGEAADTVEGGSS